MATGASQSGARILAYIKAIAPKEPIFDAFMPLIIGGMASGFDDTILDPNKLFAMPPGELAKLMRPSTKIRNALKVSVMLLIRKARQWAAFHAGSLTVIDSGSGKSPARHKICPRPPPLESFSGFRCTREGRPHRAFQAVLRTVLKTKGLVDGRSPDVLSI